MSEAKANYKQYLQGKEPLRHAVLQFDGDKVFDFVRKSNRRSMWVIPMKKWQEYQDDLKKNNPHD